MNSFPPILALNAFSHDKNPAYLCTAVAGNEILQAGVHSNPGRFGPIPVRSGRFGPGRFGPISGVSLFGPVGAGRFGPIS